MRKLVLIGLLGLYFLAMLKPIMPYIDYAINFDYISTELCENLDKPELKCLGKCHLSQEIDNSKENEENPAAPKSKKIVEEFHIAPLYSVVVLHFEDESTIKRIDSEMKLLNGFISDIFEPPKA